MSTSHIKKLNEMSGVGPFKGSIDSLKELLKEENFSAEFEMVGAFLEMSPEEIAEEWEISTQQAENIKRKAEVMVSSYMNHLKKALDSLEQIQNMNSKYFI